MHVARPQVLLPIKGLKRTSWYSYAERPGRVGFYQVKSKVGEVYLAHWDGQYWHDWSVLTRSYRMWLSEYDVYKWRGLVAKPLSK